MTILTSGRVAYLGMRNAEHVLRAYAEHGGFDFVGGRHIWQDNVMVGYSGSQIIAVPMNPRIESACEVLNGISDFAIENKYLVRLQIKKSRN